MACCEGRDYDNNYYPIAHAEIWLFIKGGGEEEKSADQYIS